MKVGMVVQRFIVVLLIVVFVGSVRAEDAKEVVVASAQELKGIKAKKITWKKDGAKMVWIPMITSYTEVGDPVYQVFYMDTDRSYCGAIQEVFKVFWL
jgi:hypothetical protein